MLEFRLDTERDDNQNICMPIVDNISDVITSFWTTGLPLILELDSFISETILTVCPVQQFMGPVNTK